MLFADLSGFTTMAERLDPEIAAELSNAFLRELTEATVRYGGSIDKFLGDGMLAIFGIPQAHENDAERATRAALDMLARVRQLDLRGSVPHAPPLAMHVGIATGEVVAAQFGTTEHAERSLVGDTVNLASRLLSAARSGQIVVDERTRSSAADSITFRELGKLKVKGRIGKVEAAEAVAVRDERAARARGPFVGRRAEQRQLQEMLARARAGWGGVVAVVGDAGIGKSRLILEMRRSAPDVRAYGAAALNYEAPRPYQIFADLSRDVLGIARSDGESAARAKLDLWLRESQAPPQVAASFAGLLGLREPQLLYMTDEVRRKGIAAAVSFGLATLCRQGASLVILEDLHWMDPESADIVGAIVSDAPRSPILIACAYRPDFRPAWPRDSVTVIELGPLAPADVSAMSESQLGRPMAEVEAFLNARAEGNPFFVEELLRTAIEHGALHRGRGGYVWESDKATQDLPATVEGVVRARLDQLEARVRETLQLAAVIGRRFPPALLSSVSVPPGRAWDDLKDLEARQLVRPESPLGELEYVFKHFVTRDVAYSTILLRRRRSMHRTIAEAIERIYEDRLDEFREILGHHYAAAEEWKKASEHYARAGRSARERLSDAAAGRFYAKREASARALVARQQRPSAFRVFVVVVWLGAVAALTLRLVGYLRIGPDAATGLALATLNVLLTTMLLLVVRVVGQQATTFSVYDDRFVLLTSRKTVIVPFASLSGIAWYSEIWSLEGLRKGMLRRGAIHAFGTFTLSDYLDTLYFGDGPVIGVLRQDGPPIWLYTSDDPEDLYHELRLAVRRWGAGANVDVTGLFSPRPNPLRDTYPIALRADGTTRLLTYRELIRLVEDDRISAVAEVALDTDKGVRWVPLADAARGDPRLAAALHPVRHSMSAAARSRLTWFVTALGLLQILQIAPLPPHHVPIGFVALIPLILWYLRVGLLRRARRARPLLRRAFAAVTLAVIALAFSGGCLIRT